MTKLIMFQGLPGSGKSTLAEALVKELGSHRAVRVNRDDIRVEVAGPNYFRPVGRTEKQVSKISDERMRAGLAEGKTVINDDTNLNTRTIQSLMRIADEAKAEFEVIPVDVPVSVARERNKARGDAGGRFVPEGAIFAMAKRAYGTNGRMKELVLDWENLRAYMIDRETVGGKLLDAFNELAVEANPLTGSKVVLVDCDGTLANNAHHAAFAFGQDKKDYKFFFESIKDAPVNETVRDLVNRYVDAGYPVMMLTGRSDEAAQELLDFVEASGARLSRVIAKREGDFRPDFIFKAEVLKSLEEEGLQVVAAIDDRPQSIRVWDRRGIHVDRVDFINPVYDPENRGPVPTPFVNTPHVDAIDESIFS